MEDVRMKKLFFMYFSITIGACSKDDPATEVMLRAS